MGYVGKSKSRKKKAKRNIELACQKKENEYIENGSLQELFPEVTKRDNINQLRICNLIDKLIVDSDKDNKDIETYVKLINPREEALLELYYSNKLSIEKHELFEKKKKKVKNKKKKADSEK